MVKKVKIFQHSNLTDFKHIKEPAIKGYSFVGWLFIRNNALNAIYLVAKTFLSFANLGNPSSLGGVDSPWINGKA